SFDLLIFPLSKYQCRLLTSEILRFAACAIFQSAGDLPCTNSAPSSIGTNGAGIVKTRPPIRSRASMTTTAHPARLRSRAAASPAAPAPIMITERVGMDSLQEGILNPIRAGSKYD